jgi:RNA ligase/Phosphotransferase enzyme family
VGEAETRGVLRSRVTVLEKLDGLNVGLDFDPARRLRFWSRARGEVRPEAMGPSLWPLLDWAYAHLVQLWSLLGRRRVLFGEMLGLPGALPYPRRPDDFVGLGIRLGKRFVDFEQARRELAAHEILSPPILLRGVPRDLGALCRRSRWGGPAEGVVLEHQGAWLKWVRDDFDARLAGVGSIPSSGEARSAPTSQRTVRKWFAAERAADAELEVAVLRRGVGPRLLAVERSARGIGLTLEHVGARQWPKRVGSAALVVSLGRALKRLHSPRGIPVAAPALPSSPAAHARPVSRPLARLLAAQETSLPSGPPVLCHGDLKPSNVRVDSVAAHLIDFDHALYAERAWELGCVADRLDLPRRLLPSLWRSAGVKSGNEVARAALYRLAWTFVVAGDPRRGGPTAGRLREAARRRARQLSRWL